jgi:hypothetical protein
MTPEQAARLKAWSYASIGGGIACLVAAYQFAFTTPKEGAPSVTVGVIFTAIAAALFIAAAVLAIKMRKSGTPPATTDLNAPGGKTVKVLLAIGLAAMAATWLVRYVTPEDELLGASLSMVLLVIAVVCLISAGRIAKRMRDAAAGAAKK